VTFNLETYREALQDRIDLFEMPGDPVVTAVQIGLRKAMDLTYDFESGSDGPARLQ